MAGCWVNPKTTTVNWLCTRFSLCQFKPEHELNPDTLAAYKANGLRVVPEVVYSPWATEEHMAETGTKAEAWRIDLLAIRLKGDNTYFLPFNKGTSEGGAH
jgi:hypothetical protein